MNPNAVIIMTVNNGVNEEKKLKLSPGSKIVFGRSQASDVCIADKTVSRTHAEFRVNENGVYFKNYGINGTVINDRCITHNNVIHLKKSVKIGIGICELNLNISHGEETVVLRHTMAASNGHDKTRVFSRKKTLPDMGNLFDDEISKANAPVIREDYSHEAAIEDNTPAKKNDIKKMVQELSGKYLKSTISKISAGVFLLLILFMMGKMLFTGSGQPSQGKNNTAEAAAGYDANFIIPIELPTDMLPGPVPQAELDKAAIYFKTAETLFMNRELHEQNLYASIQKWQQGIYILGKYTSGADLEIFTRAVEESRNAISLLSKKIAGWKDNARINYKKKDFRKAYEYIQKIIIAIPDIHHPDYKWARKNEIKLKVKVK